MIQIVITPPDGNNIICFAIDDGKATIELYDPSDYPSSQSVVVPIEELEKAIQLLKA